MWDVTIIYRFYVLIPGGGEGGGEGVEVEWSRELVCVVFAVI